MTTAARGEPAGAGPREEATRPRGTGRGAPRAVDRPPAADCAADPTGGLTFTIAADAPCGHPACLLLRRRGTDPVEEVRLPLTPLGDGRLRAVLGIDMPLTEARWDAYLLDGDGTCGRLAPGVHDLRALTGREPGGGADAAPVAVRVPYATRQGDLAVRSWWRAPHAEVGDLHIARDRAVLTVHGRVHAMRDATQSFAGDLAGVIGHAPYRSAGAPSGDGQARTAVREFTSQAYGELRRRGAPYPVRRVEVVTDGPRFSYAVDYRELVAAASPGVWDLWLRPAGAAGPRVRLARLLDDVADKKGVFVFPAVRVASRAGAGRTVDVWPYYTVDNDLAVRVDAEGGRGAR